MMAGDNRLSTTFSGTFGRTDHNHDSAAQRHLVCGGCDHRGVRDRVHCRDRHLVTAFSTVDARHIVAQRYIFESVCLGYHDGTFVRSVDYRSERRIDVRDK
jgi:hypothetical protein